MDDQIDDLLNRIRGGRENTDIPPPTLQQRIGAVASATRLSTVKPTQTQLTQYDIASNDFKPLIAKLRALVDVDIPKFEKQLADVGAPLPPGVLP